MGERNLSIMDYFELSHPYRMIIEQDATYPKYLAIILIDEEDNPTGCLVNKEFIRTSKRDLVKESIMELKASVRVREK